MGSRSLRALGWDDVWEAASRAADDGSLVPARIVAEHRGAYHAHGPGGIAWCEATGRAFHLAADKRDLPVVGDWVHLERWALALADGGGAVIREILPRRNLLTRRAAGEAVAAQPLCANVDVGIVMTSANAELSLERLERYVAMLRDAGVPVALVLSKIDLVGDAAPVLERVRAVAPDAPALALSTVEERGIADLEALVGAGKTAVLLGSSGVGKSTLLNALVGSAQPTRPIRDDDRGRHATTRRELFAARGGSLWIDMPGMRELARWEDERDDDEDDDAFDDVAQLAASCKFRDCRHLGEPGCAVRGVVDERRLQSFYKLATEQRTGARDQKTARRIAQTRAAKAKRYAPRTGKGDDES